jgi:hypothetical protein
VLAALRDGNNRRRHVAWVRIRGNRATTRRGGSDGSKHSGYTAVGQRRRPTFQLGFGRVLWIFAGLRRAQTTTGGAGRNPAYTTGMRGFARACRRLVRADLT